MSIQYNFRNPLILFDDYKCDFCVIPTYILEIASIKIDLRPSSSHFNLLHYVVWSDDMPSYSDIFFLRNNRPFKTFGNTININYNSGSSNLPQIAILSSG